MAQDLTPQVYLRNCNFLEPTWNQLLFFINSKQDFLSQREQDLPSSMFNSDQKTYQHDLFPAFKSKSSHFIQNMQQFIMSYFSVKCWKVKSWHIFCCFTFVQFSNTRDFWGTFLNSQKFLILDHTFPFEYLATFLSNNLKIDVISFESGLIVHNRDANIKRKLIGFLCIFRIQYVIGKSCSLLVKLILCLERYNLRSLIIVSATLQKQRL